jgi:truncated hemoglobin YjbI
MKKREFMTGIRVAFVLSLMILGAKTSCAEDTLYQRLGGRATIKTIVSDFVDMTRKDARIRMNSSCKVSMDSCKPEEVKNNLTMIVCQESGGPCDASQAKASMAKLVSKMELTEGEWAAMHDDFSAALIKFKLTQEEQFELHQILFKAHDKSVH